MFRTFRTARRKPAKKFTSAFAMAIALAGGSALASTAFVSAAQAQEYTDAFVELYQPAADVVNAEGGDVATVSSQFPAIVSAAVTPDDQFAAGNLLLIAGNKANNTQWQRQGLELQLASGKVPPESVGQYSWFVGNLAFQMEDYAAARQALLKAVDAGWTEQDPSGLIAETYFTTNDAAGGVAYVLETANARLASGAPVPERILLRSLQATYDQELLDESTELSSLLVTQHTNETNWTNALQVVNALGDFDAGARLDLLRLMRLTGALTDNSEYVRYIESADPRIMSNEVGDVLAEGLAAGEFDAGDTYYVEVKGIVDDRMTTDRADAPELVADARASASGRDALSAGDVLYSLDDYAGAEEMFAMANTKGGVDANTALTRLAIAQIRQGKYAEGVATLEGVSGVRAPIAKMWSAYAQTKM